MSYPKYLSVSQCSRAAYLVHEWLLCFSAVSNGVALCLNWKLPVSRLGKQQWQWCPHDGGTPSSVPSPLSNPDLIQFGICSSCGTIEIECAIIFGTIQYPWKKNVLYTFAAERIAKIWPEVAKMLPYRDTISS